MIILDGYGINPQTTKNAVRDAKTPNLDQLFKDYPFLTIEAGGEKVGLPKGVAGNSEVGHMNLGAGRPVRQDLVRVNEAIRLNTLKDMPALQELITKAKSGTKRIHLMGLLSDGGVHSHIDHFKAVVSLLSQHPELKIFYHAFLDGRDTPPQSAEKYLLQLQEIPGFTLASVQGRSIGMDRDRRWDKIEQAYAMFTGAGAIKSVSPLEYLKSEYEQGRFDEFVAPVLFDSSYKMQNDDCLFFLNFRPDRAGQLSLAFNDPEFKEFKQTIKPAFYLCMTPYIPDEVSLPILFDKEKVTGGLSEYLAKLGKKQFKIAETEKYAHVTYFFNGGEKKPFPGEKHLLIPSPREVKTYNQKPEMSAPEVTSELLKAMEEDYDFYLVNFANCDMVGHTGDYHAVVKAVEVIDTCVGQLLAKAQEKKMAVLLTADHGNCDQMVYEDDSPHTSHTGAPVPLSLFHEKLKGVQVEISAGPHALMDVAPTVLNLMGCDQPTVFVGKPIFS